MAGTTGDGPSDEGHLRDLSPSHRRQDQAFASAGAVTTLAYQLASLSAQGDGLSLGSTDGSDLEQALGGPGG